jgi:hypothetical protein
MGQDGAEVRSLKVETELDGWLVMGTCCGERKGI